MNVGERLPNYADVFPFESFNRMQEQALPSIIERDENVVVSAPTASGKTALAELAICKTLEAGGTALFLAPLRALTNEKEREWERFEELGYSVYVVTGERDLNPRRAERADILVMTPEKADSATRKHDSSRYRFVRDVDCCVIDEVHLLDSDSRGSVLEVTVSRLRRLCDPRIVALSATMSNVDDVAAWLDAVPKTTFEFGSEYRPVPLSAEVETYTHGENPFADKYRRLYRALDIAEPHIRDGGQALVFVASRQDTKQSAEKARDELASRDVPMGARGDFDFHTETAELTNETLRNSVLDGVGYHHAGLAREDKNRVEEWFREGDIQLLFSTSTLAWGVNLPARCVVIRDTKLHDPLEGEVDMSPLDLLQMLGRAGRPGYDDAGYASVVCDGSDAKRYRRLLRDGKPIESRLAEDLAAHLNAEIALGTVQDIDSVMEWLETTFYFVRAQRSGEYASGAQLREKVRETLSSLVDDGFVETARNEAPLVGEDEVPQAVGQRGTESLGQSTVGRRQRDAKRLKQPSEARRRSPTTPSELQITPTPLAQLTSQFYLELETAVRFAQLTERDSLTEADILAAVAGAAEFDSVSSRQAERDAIAAVLSNFEMTVVEEPSHRKVLAILRASTTGSTPTELQSDAWVIRHNALRLLAALQAFLDRFSDPIDANLAARVAARVENGISERAVGLTAIDGVGSGRATKLSSAGLAGPTDVVANGTDGLVDAGLTEGIAERIAESARELPAAEIEWGAFPESIPAGENDLQEVTVSAKNGGGRAGITVTVNGKEMSQTTTHLGEATVPVGVFGGNASELEYTITVAFPDHPLVPHTESKTVRVA